MSADDRDRWDERWSTAQPRPVVPPAALGAVGSGSTVELPASGRALDVACGGGSVSVWLAGAGFDVLGIDVSPVAVDRAHELATAHGVADRTRFEVVDLDDGLNVDPGGFAVVVCQRFRDPARYDDLVAAMAPGGLLIVTVLSTVGTDDAASSGLGPFRAAPGELVVAFADRLEVLASVEADGEAHFIGRHR